ncbi:hypothetical protein U1Q18_014715 [Sarracenia purpurea var. burkii]
MDNGSARSSGAIDNGGGRQGERRRGQRLRWRGERRDGFKMCNNRSTTGEGGGKEWKIRSKPKAAPRDQNLATEAHVTQSLEFQVRLQRIARSAISCLLSGKLLAAAATAPPKHHRTIKVRPSSLGAGDEVDVKLRHEGDEVHNGSLGFRQAVGDGDEDEVREIGGGGRVKASVNDGGGEVTFGEEDVSELKHRVYMALQGRLGPSGPCAEVVLILSIILLDGWCSIDCRHEFQ